MAFDSPVGVLIRLLCIASLPQYGIQAARTGERFDEFPMLCGLLEYVQIHVVGHTLKPSYDSLMRHSAPEHEHNLNMQII